MPCVSARPRAASKSKSATRRAASARPGEHGEIHLRSPHMMIGHVDEQGFHELPEGEFHATGDLGYRDERGRLFLAGRAHDVMKTGGYKIYPEEIERVLPGGRRGGRHSVGALGRGDRRGVGGRRRPTAAVAAATAGLARYKQPRACLTHRDDSAQPARQGAALARARAGACALRDDRRALSEVRSALSFHSDETCPPEAANAVAFRRSRTRTTTGNVMRRIVTDQPSRLRPAPRGSAPSPPPRRKSASRASSPWATCSST